MPTDNSLGDMNSINALVDKAYAIIQEKSDGMSADKTLEALRMQVKQLKSYSLPEGLVPEDTDSVASDMSDLGNLTFTYEEEADP